MSYAPPPYTSSSISMSSDTKTLSRRMPPPLPQRSGGGSSAIRVRILYEYNTGVSGDLQAFPDEIVVVTDKLSEDWWQGYVEGGNGEEGIFPTNYIEVLGDSKREMDDLYDTYDMDVKRGSRNSFAQDDQDYLAPPTRNPASYAPGASSSRTSSPGRDPRYASALQNHLNPADPFNPLPQAFLRPISSPCSPSFRPIHIFSNATKDLTPGLLPGSAPFPSCPAIPSHDVFDNDWSDFLQGLQNVTRLSAGNRIVSNGIPLVLGASFFTGMLVTGKVESLMKQPKTQAGILFVQRWNTDFFQPRGLDVYIAQGTNRLSGPVNANTNQYVPFPNNSGGGMMGQGMGMGMNNGMYGNQGMMAMGGGMMGNRQGGLISSLVSAGMNAANGNGNSMNNGMNNGMGGGNGLNGALQGFQGRRAMKDAQKMQEDYMKDMQKQQKKKMKGGGMMGMGGMGMNGMGMGMGGMNGMNGMGMGNMGMNGGMGMGMGMGMNGGGGVDATVMGPGAMMQNPMAFRLIIECLEPY